MESDAHALKTGLFLLVAGLLLAGTLVAFGDRRPPSRAYLIDTTESVAGLAVESRVYYKGVEVGRVTEIGFPGDDYNRVRLRIAVDERIPLGVNTYAQLQLRGITGEYDLTLDNDGPLGARLTPGDDGGLPEIPMRTQYIVRIGEAIEAAVGELEGLAASARALTEGENRERLERILDGAAEAMERFVKLEEQFAGAVERLPGTLDRVGPAVDDFAAAMGDVRVAAQQLTQRTTGLDPLITTMTRATRSLDRLLVAMEGSTLADVEVTLESLQQALDQLSELAASLRRDPQSLLLGAPPPRLGPGESR